jgi:transmembrane sensor
MKKDIKEVLDKISSGSYSQEEEDIAKLWLHQLHEHDETGLSEQQLDAVSNEMWLSLEVNKKQPWLGLRRSWISIAAAASITIVIGLSLYFYKYPSSKATKVLQVFSHDLPAGSNKAYLTLGNGKKILLSGSTIGTLAIEAGVKITKTADGQVVYTVADQGKQEGSEYNSIETPRGGQYELHLPDGTKVWLNASSSLKYPSSFAALKERKVELTGEGYFEVSKDKTRPFLVSSRGQVVEVLGTHFDVSAYQDEATVKTTLLEGSVKLNKQVMLKPGEQSVLADGKFKVTEVNVNDAIDWKNGEFAFVNEPLSDIMKKVARWYDVEIVYTHAVAIMPTFTGSVSRSENISSVLSMLEETSTVRFSIEGKQIKVNIK